MFIFKKIERKGNGLWDIFLNVLLKYNTHKESTQIINVELNEFSQNAQTYIATPAPRSWYKTLPKVRSPSSQWNKKARKSINTPSSEQATCIEHYTQQLENTDSFQEHM